MNRTYKTSLTIPAGTADSAPASVAWPLEDAYLTTIQVIIPPGPSGLVGVRVSRAGTPIIPFSSNTWFVSDDEKPVFPYFDEMTAAGLTIEGYNNDINDHTIEFRGVIQDAPSTGAPTAITTPIVPNNVISNAPTVAP